MSMSRQMDKKVVVHIQMECYSAIKKENILVTSNEVDEIGAYYTE